VAAKDKEGGQLVAALFLKSELIPSRSGGRTRVITAALLRSQATGLD